MATGLCPTCQLRFALHRDGTLWRHKGSAPFDLATDGICSDSGQLPVAGSEAGA